MPVRYCKPCDKSKMVAENEAFCSVCGAELGSNKKVTKTLSAHQALETPYGLSKALLIDDEQAQVLFKMLENLRFEVEITQQYARVVAVNGYRVEEL